MASFAIGRCIHRRRKKPCMENLIKALSKRQAQVKIKRNCGMKRPRGDESNLKLAYFVSIKGVVHSVKLTKKSKCKPVHFSSTTGIGRSVEEKVEKVEVATEQNQNAAEIPPMGVEMATSSHTRKVEIIAEEHGHFLSATEFGRQIVDTSSKQTESEEREGKPKSPTSSSASASAGTSGFGTFEEHTRAIGIKLLVKMGYNGGGLGKDGQGIAVPIATKRRPSKIGIGFNEFLGNDSGLELTDNLKKPKKKPKKWKNSWRVSNMLFKKSSRRSAVEMLIEMHGVETVQFLLHMSRPLKDFTNFKTLKLDDTLLSQVRNRCKASAVELVKPQRKTKIQRLLDKSEKIRRDHNLNHAKGKVLVFSEEAKQLENDLLSQKQQIANLEAIVNSIQTLQDKVSMGVVSEETVTSSFADIKSNYRAEYEMYNVEAIALWFLMLGTVAEFPAACQQDNPTTIELGTCNDKPGSGWSASIAASSHGDS